MATPAPASTAEAMDLVMTGLRYLVATDPTALASQAQAECLQNLEHADAMSTAVRAWFLTAFTAGQGYCDDADYSPTAWLIHRTKVTKGAARGHVGWARRAITHPQVLTALAEGTVLSESMAHTICGWSDRLPEECRPAADAILIAAARAGARQEDLAAQSHPALCKQSWGQDRREWNVSADHRGMAVIDYSPPTRQMLHVWRVRVDQASDQQR